MRVRVGEQTFFGSIDSYYITYIFLDQSIGIGESNTFQLKFLF